MTKKINPQNWLERDDTLNNFVPATPDSPPTPISRQAWVELILTPQMQASVPREVQRLYEGARGALVYGYFYYALCMVGTLGLFRVAEAALAYKRQQLEAPPFPEKSGVSFDENLHWLANRGLVRPADWQRISAARNSAAQLQSQEILPILEQVTDQINALFPAQSS